MQENSVVNSNENNPIHDTINTTKSVRKKFKAHQIKKTPVYIIHHNTQNTKSIIKKRAQISSNKANPVQAS